MIALKLLKIALQPMRRNLSEVEEQDPSHYTFGRQAVTLAHFMGCRYKIFSSKRFENGNWQSLSQVMNRVGADIVLQKYDILSQLSQEYAYSYPTEIGEITFATQSPTPSPNPNAIFQPFFGFVWVSLAVSMLAMALAFSRFFKNRSFSDSVFSVIATASRQAPLFHPRTSSERIVMGSWLFGMTIITAAYLSLLLSLLTFPNLRGVRNILELANAVEKGDYQCLSFQRNPYHKVFLNSSIKAHRIIGNNVIIENDFLGVMSSSANKVAYLHSREVFKLAAPFIPGLVISEDSFYMTMVVFQIRKDFRFKDKLNRAFRRMIETGIYAKLHTFQFYPLVDHSDEAQLIRKLTLMDFKSVFIMLLVGYGVSFIIFLLEKLAFKLEHLKIIKKW